MPIKTNYQQWKKNLLDTGKATQEAIRATTPSVGRDVRDLIRQRVPPGSSGGRFPGYAATGRLKNAIVAGPVRNWRKGFAVKVGIGASASAKTRMIARVHEYGMTIHAKRAPYLVFKIKDQWISVKQVTIKEKRFFRDGWAEAKQRFPEFVGKYIKQRFPRQR